MVIPRARFLSGRELFRGGVSWPHAVIEVAWPWSVFSASRNMARSRWWKGARSLRERRGTQLRASAGSGGHIWIDEVAQETSVKDSSHPRSYVALVSPPSLHAGLLAQGLRRVHNNAVQGVLYALSLPTHVQVLFVACLWKCVWVVSDALRYVGAPIFS